MIRTKTKRIKNRVILQEDKEINNILNSARAHALPKDRNKKAETRVDTTAWNTKETISNEEKTIKTAIIADFITTTAEITKKTTKEGTHTSEGITITKDILNDYQTP